MDNCPDYCHTVIQTNFLTTGIVVNNADYHETRGNHCYGYLSERICGQLAWQLLCWIPGFVITLFFSSYFQFWLAWESLGYDGSNHLYCWYKPTKYRNSKNKQFFVYLNLVDTFINLRGDRDIGYHFQYWHRIFIKCFKHLTNINSWTTIADALLFQVFVTHIFSFWGKFTPFSPRHLSGWRNPRHRVGLGGVSSTVLGLQD